MYFLEIFLQNIGVGTKLKVGLERGGGGLDDFWLYLTFFFLLLIFKSEIMLFLLLPVYIYSVYSVIINNLFINFSFLYLELIF